MSLEEVLDLVDIKGNVIGQATKRECHSNPELVHRTVVFAVVDKEKKKVLLTKRSLSKENDPGLNTFLGEHILSGEIPFEAVKRGVKEELGFLPIDVIDLDGSHIFRQEHQTELVSFFAAIYNGEEISFDKEEMDSIWWIDLDDLLKYKEEVSEMTKYCIDNSDWSKI